MTERKPPGTSWESWIDQQIREAQEEGAFDNLPGAGKPLADLEAGHDPLWWVKKLVQRFLDVKESPGPRGRAPGERPARKPKRRQRRSSESLFGRAKNADPNPAFALLVAPVITFSSTVRPPKRPTPCRVRAMPMRVS